MCQWRSCCWDYEPRLAAWDAAFSLNKATHFGWPFSKKLQNMMAVTEAFGQLGAQPLEIRPRHEDDGSRAERQEQHDAEVEFYSLPSLLSSVHLNETSGATARAHC